MAPRASIFKITLPMTYKLKTPRLQQEKIHRFIVRVGSVLTSYKQPKIAKLIGVSAVANVVTSPNIRPCICSGICSPNQLKNGTFTKFEIPALRCASNNCIFSAQPLLKSITIVLFFDLITICF